MLHEARASIGNVRINLLPGPVRGDLPLVMATILEIFGRPGWSGRTLPGA
jgi:hypothetical protein